MSDRSSDPVENDGSNFITHIEGASPGDQRRLNDEIGIPSIQAIGGLAGDPDSDDDFAEPANTEPG